MKMNRATRKLMSSVFLKKLFMVKYMLKDRATRSPTPWRILNTDGHKLYEKDAWVPHASIKRYPDTYSMLQDWILQYEPSFVLYDSNVDEMLRLKLNRKHPWMRGFK